MWTLARNGKKFGYCTTSKEGIEKYREWYIDDHVVSESAQIQQRLWDTSKKTLLASEAEQVARDTLEEQITVMELS
jgi:hypothetical protein